MLKKPGNIYLLNFTNRIFIPELNFICRARRNYKQQFRTEWALEKPFSDWIVVVDAEDKRERQLKCKYCLCQLGSKKSTLKAHANTRKHRQAAAPFTGVSKLVQPFLKTGKSNEIKQAEVRIALFVAKHSNMNTVEHLIEMLKASFSSPLLKELKMKRTKCGQIIKRAIYPHFINELLADIGNSVFSLIIDESTDIATIKYLGIVIKYFSVNVNDIVTTYLKLVEIDKCDAESIVNAIKNLLLEYEIPLQNMVGLGTDNASVMVGVNNGVYQKLKKEVPHLMLIPCICHSLQLAVSAATAEFLPPKLEYMISETYNWFARSTLRQKSYQLIYQTINNGHNPLKIVRSCQTRWLSIETAVKRIIDQCDE